jgi:hypothetical protein
MDDQQQMRMSIPIVLYLLLLAAVARAETGTLVDHVPGGADPAIVVAVVKQALINRTWTVTAFDANSVTAKIDHSLHVAEVRIFLSQGRLLYEGTAIRTYQMTPQQPPTKRKSRVPKKWLTYLRRDISATLSTMPEHR